MANMSFDFNKFKKSFFTVDLKDGRKIVVKMPMKKTFEKITSLGEIETEKMSAEDAMDILGRLCAEILSNNMNKEKVTGKYMTENYDMEEMSEFISKYYEFTGVLKKDPNSNCPTTQEA